MVSVEEATSIILSHARPTGTEVVALEQCAGRILAEQVRADRDLPPFDRVTMDGIALISSGYRNGHRSFRLAGVQAAGQPSLKLGDNTACIEVMTGAMMPDGADAIVPYEDVRITDGKAELQITEIKPGEFIHRRGIDARKGDSLLSEGIRLSPAEVAVLASVGRSNITVRRCPSVAVVSTGDELVEVDQIPAAHQIRKSNTFALQAALKEWSGAINLFSMRDDRDQMRSDLTSIIANHQLILLSGGVSKGKFDFVPEILAELGIERRFHMVRQRPGKPFWFGTSSTNTVFALPGNPVSTFLCYYRYVRPWLIKSFGLKPSSWNAVLATDYTFAPSLTYFLQVRTEDHDGTRVAYPDTGGGSGDFANLKAVDGFIELPADRSQFSKGEIFPYFPLRTL